ncbi:MAG: DUF2589 domain-containing protein, partial [Prevotella sp.]|nr:DUF2589 domain-containing protein [Prevotella sp.]
IQNGRMAQLNVPLLTIVPIPYIAIQDIDISFKANISASSSSVSKTNSSSSLNVGGGFSSKLGWGPFSMRANMTANYSSKKDSKATQNSKYSVEYTMDVAVKAAQDSMPAGLAKVLELLGSALDVSDPDGTLEISETNLVLTDDDQPVKLIATYKNPKGLFEPEAIKVKDKDTEVTGTKDSNRMVFELKTTGQYTVTAGNKTLTVEVTSSKKSTTDHE